MKRLIALLMALVLCLSLCACNSNTNVSENNDIAQTESVQTEQKEDTVQLTKEEMISQAKYAEADIINDVCYDNFVKAKKDYCNQILKLKGTVKTFGENYVELEGFSGAKYIIDVYMPEEELLNLQSGLSIVVVGQTTDEIIKETNNYGGYSFDTYHFQMPVAYLVKDTVEIEGELRGLNQSFKPAFNIEIGGSSYLKRIYFKEDVDVSTLKWGQKIKFSAKAIDEGNDHWVYRDAEIIEFIE